MRSAAQSYMTTRTAYITEDKHMIDSCAFVGSWPFRKLSRSTVPDLVQTNRRLGIDGAVVSCLDSVFYNDPSQGDSDLSGSLPEGYLFAMTHNPMLPFAVHDVSVNAYNACSLRLFPSIHGYSPDSPESIELCRAAAAAGLWITVVYKMDDVRMDYLMRQTVPSFEAITNLVRAVPEASFVLSGFGAENVLAHAEAFNTLANLYTDIVYSSKVIFPVDALVSGISPDKILFATHQCMLCPDIGVLTLDHSSISPETRGKIAEMNLKRLCANRILHSTVIAER